MPYRQTIAAAYDAGVDEEYLRLTENPLKEAEFQLIVELINEYIPDGSTIIDVGSGPGRYAEYLLKRNCKVGLVDLSALSLKAFSDRMNGLCCQENIIFNQVSCATQLEWIAGNSADAVLLMGPMYHLVNEEHRNVALTNCHRILKPGGFLFTVFLSPFPAVQNIEETTTHTHFQGFDVPQFRCWPEVAKKVMRNNGFETIRTRNIEGIGTSLPEYHWKGSWSDQKKKALLDSLHTTCENPDFLGITQQYICVGNSLHG
jgi:ubiquinone/menaquinone biosynthesis C-methylase UbiE